jgi:two-component system sensor histidine kinase PhcS
MDIIVVVGTYVQERLRFREFEFRYKLNKSKQDLEDSNRNLEVFNNRLADQNIALNRANREIKEAEAQLVQAEKMASLGRFSAGLMHDVLNPLNYVKTGLFTLQKKSRLLAPDKSAEFTQILADVKDGLDRVQDIVQGLRNFTHPGEQSAELIDLAGILADVRRFVAGGLKDKNISLEINLLPQQMVWIGRNDFSVMLINLLENSIDAFENKTFADGDRPAITVSSRSSGDRTLVAIRDNGSGIDPKIIAKIFDPFFTTKDVGKGTGLGLSICFGMIRGYGGTISVASEQGKFSEFTLDLPANAEAAAQYKIAHAEPIRL